MWYPYSYVRSSIPRYEFLINNKIYSYIINFKSNSINKGGWIVDKCTRLNNVLYNNNKKDSEKQQNNAVLSPLNEF